jgi:guanidinoacetate N-methyltransferase
MILPPEPGPEGSDQPVERWGRSPAIYDAHSLEIDGHRVMEDWELDYMKRLSAVATGNGGAVLEVGYGLGLSSRAIQAERIRSHTIIECHPDVLARCLTDNRVAFEQGTIHLYSGFWHDTTPSLASGQFDGILFDTYPIEARERIGPHMWFFKEAFRLLKRGGVLTYYSNEAEGFSELHMQMLLEAGFERDDIGFELCRVRPPEDCEYWRSSTIVVPIVRKAV